MIKKLLLLCSIILAPSLCFSSGDKLYQPVGNFIGGVNSNYSSLYIADNEVQDALNVYFDKDYAVTKRNGFSVYGTTNGVRYYNSIAYTDSSSNNWLIGISTAGIFASNSNGTFSVRIATVPTFNTSLVACVNALGKVYFVDQVQGVYYWDGVTTTYEGASSPKGSLIAEFHSRIWVAGLAAPNQNKLYGSEFLNGSNWTTGSLATDPVILNVGLSDNYDGVTCLFAGYNDTLYVLKQFSVNGVFGFDQTDFQVRILTRDAGCIDSGSIQPFRGYLIFASGRGVELFDGSTCQLISKKIKNKFDPATSTTFAQRVWTISTEADFNSGSFVNGGYNDPIAGLTLRYPDSFTTFRDSNTALNVWTPYESTANSGSTSANGTLNILNNGGSLARECVYTSSAMANFQQGTTYHILLQSIPFDTVGTTRFLLTFTSYTVASGNPDSHTNSFWTFDFRSTQTGTAFLQQVTNDVGDSISSTTLQYTLPITLDVYLATTTYQYSINGVPIKLGNHTWPARSLFAYLCFIRGNGGSGTLQLDDWGVSPMRMNFTSPIFNIGTSINSWGSFLASQDITSGSVVFQICSSTNSNLSPANCAVQSPNTQITISTGSYSQWSASFTVTNRTDHPILYSGQVQWNEGSRRPKMASAYFEDRYLLSVATNTLSTGNDCTFILAQGLNDQLVWTIFDINSGTWLIYKNSLYHGDSNPSGNFYQDNQGYTDNGNAINSFIKTKDYVLGDILAEKIFKRLYLQAEALGNYSISTSYYLDKVSTEYTMSLATQTETGSFLNLSLPFSLDASNQVFSKLINFKFSNDGNNSQMKFYGAILAYIKRPILP